MWFEVGQTQRCLSSLLDEPSPIDRKVSFRGSFEALL